MIDSASFYNGLAGKAFLSFHAWTGRGLNNSRIELLWRLKLHMKSKKRSPLRHHPDVSDY